LLPDVVVRLAADARLVLSGILLVKRDEVVTAAEAHDLVLVDERSKGEWWAGVFTGPSRPFVAVALQGLVLG
jgi:ribosomal protein L11 methylase PrmA